MSYDWKVGFNGKKTDYRTVWRAILRKFFSPFFLMEKNWLPFENVRKTKTFLPGLLGCKWRFWGCLQRKYVEFGLLINFSGIHLWPAWIGRDSSGRHTYDAFFIADLFVWFFYCCICHKDKLNVFFVYFCAVTSI